MSIYTEAARDVLVDYRAQLVTATEKGAKPERIQHLEAAIKTAGKILFDLENVFEKSVALATVRETRQLLNDTPTALVGDEADMKTIEAAITVCLVVTSKFNGMN